MAETDPSPLAACPTFIREERFIVIKRKHLWPEKEARLRNFLKRQNIGTVESVVVEADWPEYETVWAMIEARCTDTRPQPTAAHGLADDVLHVVFDGPPGPEAGRFVECEAPDGRSVRAGEWHERSDGFWELRIPLRSSQPDTREGFAAGIEAAAKVAEAETGIYPHGNQMFGSAVPGKIAAAIRALAKETTDG